MVKARLNARPSVPNSHSRRWPDSIGGTSARGRQKNLDDATIKELNSVRKRAAHSGDVLVESRTDGDQAPGTVARETPLWQARIQERFPMPPEPGKSE
jgi:hypothetical protein